MYVDLGFLKDVVTRATGLQIDSPPTQLFKGEANAVFVVRLEDGSEVIARQNHRPVASGSTFRAEAAIIRAAAAVAVPVATVLGVEEKVMADGVTSVSVQTKLSGMPLNECLPTLRPKDLERLMGHVREAVFRIHRMDPKQAALRIADPVAWIADSAEVIHDAVQQGLLDRSVLRPIDAALTTRCRIRRRECRSLRPQSRSRIHRWQDRDRHH